VVIKEDRFTRRRGGAEARRYLTWRVAQEYPNRIRRLRDFAFSDAKAADVTQRLRASA